MGVAVLALLPIPVAVLVGSLRDPSLGRRSRFGLRLAALLVCMAVPWLVGLVGRFSDGVENLFLWMGLAWVLTLIALFPRLLFRERGIDPGQSDDDDDGGPGPEDDRRPPRRPIGGIPLPDAEQSSTRFRGPHRPRRAVRTRRPARKRERRPARLWQFMSCQSHRPLMV